MDVNFILLLVFSLLGKSPLSSWGATFIITTIIITIIIFMTVIEVVISNSNAR